MGDAPDAAYHFAGQMDLQKVKELLPLGAKAEDVMFFFCGPPAWMKMVAKQLTDLGVDKEHLAFETFGPNSEQILP